jgi:superfamily II DNA/RNA helicase
MSFKDFIDEPGILKAIEDLGYNTPTPIQKQAIPLILTGCDLRGSAQTGTGKTAAFILPALCKLAKPSKLHGKGPRVLILVPTRELAIQVAEEASKYCKYLDRIKTVCIYGGAPYPIQNRQLARPYEILVATPGRLMDHMNRGKINFSRVEMFILDEADRMLDMGFIGPVEEIAEAIPDSRQTLMFSATLKGSVMKLSERLLKDPKEISVAHDPATHDNINQRLHHVDNIEHKYKLLDHILNGKDITQAIVFTRTKHHADQLVDKLIKKGYSAGALHGNMNQRQRTKTIMRLRQGEIRILVATDVAARGIDIPAISHVINFDLPENEEDYVHRIGRTGRAGATGIALSFATPKEMGFVRQIEKFTHQKMTPHTVPGLEPRTTTSSSSTPGFVSQGNYRPKQKKSNFRRFSRR